MEKEVMITLKLTFFLLIVFILFHFLAIYNFWYWEFRWLDIPMHFIGGILVSMFFIWLDSKFKILNILQPLANAIFLPVIIGIFIYSSLSRRVGIGKIYLDICFFGE